MPMEVRTRHTLTVLVENKPGVLNRVVSLFRKRGFNIDSLTVGRTHQPTISRMTIVMEGTDLEALKVERNLYKLVNVISVENVSSRPTVDRDLALIKVGVNGQTRAEVMQICDIFRARIVDVSHNSVIVEMTGDERKIVSFVELMEPLGIIEMVRTGVVSMARGEEAMTTHDYQPGITVTGNGFQKNVL